jgi:hypothetical protein
MLRRRTPFLSAAYVDALPETESRREKRLGGTIGTGFLDEPDGGGDVQS